MTFGFVGIGRRPGPGSSPLPGLFFAMVHLGEPQVRQQVFQRIAAIKPEAPPLWGRMTAHQMVCHLSDSFRLVLGEKPVASSAHRNLLMKWAALYLPFPWPKGVPTRPEVEQGVGGTPPGDFQRDREALVALLERFSDPNHTTPRTPHPIFGQLTEREWLRWGYLHTNHHLRQFGL